MFDRSDQQLEKLVAAILHHIFVGAGFQRGHRRARVHVAGDIDDRRADFARTETRHDVEAGFADQRVIERDDVDVARRDTGDHLVAALHDRRAVAAQREALAHKRAEPLVVVNEQDAQVRAIF